MRRMALVLNNQKLRFSTFYRSVYFIPAVISPAIIAVVFQLLSSNFGATISDWLMKVHVIDAPATGSVIRTSCCG